MSLMIFLLMKVIYVTSNEKICKYYNVKKTMACYFAWCTKNC